MSSGMLTGAEAPIRPLAELSDSQLRLDAGQIGQTELSVRNPGNIVETYDLILLGPTRPWAEVSPASISLFPGEEDTSTLELRPPMSYRVPAGTYAVGVKVQSQVRPDASSTAEMLVTVNPFYRFRVSMATSSFTIRTRATMLVQVINEGNSTVTYEVTAQDPEGFMRVRPSEPRLTLSPGESRWIEVLVNVAPKLIGSEFNTRSFTVTVTPVHDEDLNIAIVDEDSEEVIGSVLQRPFVRLRLGVFGRLIVFLTILGLLAGFLISRWAQSQVPPMQGAPKVPLLFTAEPGPAAGEVLLTWLTSAGSTSYKIFAVGDAGNPQPTPEPTIVVEIPGQDTSTAGGFSAGVARGVIPREDRQPTEQELATPVCNDCSEVATVGGGVTRYVVQNVPPGLACYRIAAFADTMQSLYSTPVCAEVEDPMMIDWDGDGIPDAFQEDMGAGAGEELPPRPCPPANVQAQPVSTTSVAILWGKATTPPPGFREPRSNRFVKNESAPFGGGEDAQSGSGSASGSGSGGGGKVCDPNAEVVGWALQRQIFSGWADVNPPPAAADTALEIRDLQPDTRYCFRMRSISAERTSRWSPQACVRTDAEAIIAPPIEEAPQPAAPEVEEPPLGMTSEMLIELPR